MREIVLDTETTGLDPKAGHRIVEIACLELVNKVPTGNTFQEYLNPERDVPKEAERIHGLSNALLEGKPRFEEIADRFLAFVEEASLVIHNADFDLGFINAEFERIGRPPLDPAQGVIDTVRLARKKFPGAQASLDALCRRFEIDNSSRTLHGALLDCQLLAEVYLELVGGRQPGLDLGRKARAAATTTTAERLHHPPRPHEPSAEEIAAHGALIETLEDPIWRR